jgi:predicted phosphodiesterase
MRSDYELIKRKMAWELDGVNIYPIGDLHLGSRECNLATWLKWKEVVLSDPKGYVVIVGDMLDNTLKNSKGNCYENGMNPREAKEMLWRELIPLKDRIIGVVQGNHCYRSNQLVGECPLYDVCCRLGIEDLYRENMAFIKVNVGRRNKDRQCSYVLTLSHGGSRNKTEKFGYAIDGTDVFITGHTHSPESNFPAKIVVDTANEVVRVVDYTHVIVPSYHDLGGYALRGLYTPKSTTKFPVIQLCGTEKAVSVLWRN